MTKEEIFATVKEIIYRNTDGISRDEEIELNSHLVNDLNIDSLDRVDITLAAEREFNIKIEDAIVEDIETVEEIVDMIADKLQIIIMKKDEIFVLVREMIADYMSEMSIEDITLDSNLSHDIGMDSLDEITVIAEIEKRFNIRIDDDKWPVFISVNDLVEEIVRCLDAKK